MDSYISVTTEIDEGASIEVVDTSIPMEPGQLMRKGYTKYIRADQWAQRETLRINRRCGTNRAFVHNVNGKVEVRREQTSDD